MNLLLGALLIGLAPAAAAGDTASAPQYLNPETLYQPARHGFSQVTVVPAGTRLVYVAGQMAIDRDGKLLATDFAGQVAGAFANLRLALAAAGSDMDHVVKVTLLSADHSAEREKIIARATNAAFPGANKPASMLIPVPRLALDGVFFEIDAVAVVPERLVGDTAR